MKKFTLLATSLLLATSAIAADINPLTLKVYNADPASFSVNSTLVYGESEAVIVDAGFTKADALRIAANVLDSGRKLTIIFVSQADPDYYFGVETLKQFFPDAKVLATPEVRRIIEKKMAMKLKVWAPKMGTNAPMKPVLPEEYALSSFSIEGHEVEIKGTEGVLAHRPYLWIPSQKTILGNVAVFGGLHAWTADTQTQPQLDAWTAQLNEMLALDPEVVIPGHMEAGTSLDASTIKHTAEYLTTFATAKANSKDSNELINKMMTSYPSSKVPLALGIGAKVHMGEMKW
ncbi:MBL fold metallo-hydrolase [Vibrio algarum]|uniref:MBL fold metallo-hydrolase n=1 Tax=Vibrio algarum TaxID=3020714 RepID=A0ABT4YU02_9VIBR|nr:MBL fold metallo-hydrolase [Vibrio sp. KJ40-1]MDB1124945.1 MBL fold metallo-hydrolase [Vibrio sp. KJ40-1]